MAMRTLFEADALSTLIRVVNLTSQPYNLHRDQLFGEASQVYVDSLPLHPELGWDPNLGLYRDWPPDRSLRL